MQHKDYGYHALLSFVVWLEARFSFFFIYIFSFLFVLLWRWVLHATGFVEVIGAPSVT